MNVTVSSASPEGQLTEMRDAFLKNLAQEGGYDSYPFGKPEKRVHGLYIKHNGDTAADAFCSYHTRLHCPFRVKIRMTSQQLLIWTAYEHDHNPANDASKHIKFCCAMPVNSNGYRNNSPGRPGRSTACSRCRSPGSGLTATSGFLTNAISHAISHHCDISAISHAISFLSHLRYLLYRMR